MFSVKLKEMYYSMTYSEMKVADYLLDNRKMASELNSEKVAKQTGTSKSTISRLTQKLGYPSFKSILQDLQNEVDEDHRDFSIHRSDSCADSCEKLQNAYENVLAMTAKSLNYKDVERCVDKMEKAGKILCFGTHTSQVIAKYLANKLEEIGVDVVCQDDVYNMTSVMCQMGEDDVVIIVSHSGTSYFSKRIAEIAKRRKLFVIAIVGMDGGDIRKIADVAITSHIYSTNRTVAYAATKCSQFFLMDVLYINLYRRNVAKYDQAAEMMYRELSPEIGRGDYKNNRRGKSG